MKRTMMLWAMGLSVMATYAQWETDGNATLDPVDNYIGTNDNRPLNFRTDSIFRMRLYPTTTSNDSLGLFRLRNSGFLGLSARPEFFTDTPGPFSRLHLVDSVGVNNPNIYAQFGSFRPWQRNGITFTGNADHGYIGQKYNTMDRSDMVIHWSNDVGAMQFAPDYLRFIFTGGYDSTRLTGARSLEGAEGMRLYPVNDTSIFVGVGDFFKATVDSGFAVRPSERLDILDRTIRIRSFMDSLAYRNDTLDQIVVSDSTGRLHWRPMSTLDDCDWTVVPDTNWNHIVTAYAGNPGCPQWLDGVGVGVNWPKAKLHVLHDNSNENFSGDVTFSQLVSSEQGGIGIRGEARTVGGSDFLNSAFTGVLGTADNARYSYGVSGFATMGPQASGPATDVIGTRGLAWAADNAIRCVGVHGRAAGAIVDQTWGFSNSWAGWFDGNVFSPYGQWTMSDGELKQDIEDLTSAGDVLAQLSPKSYSFNVDQFGFMGLEPGLHLGLLAEEVEQVLPHAVRSVVRPAELDSMGVEVHPQVEFKALNYQEIIPLLIAGHREQQEQADEQAQALQQLQEQVAQLQQLLAQCCSQPVGDADGRSLQMNEQGQAEAKSDRLLAISPNPFTDHTAVSYILERGGRAMLLVNSSDGKQLQVLHEAVLEQGEYRYEWSTGHLAPGMYYVTLLLDGEPLVKRAVKVQ